MNVLQVTNLYPYPGNPIYGIFVKEQVDSLRQISINTDVLFINAQAEGKIAYLTAVNKIRKMAKNYDLVHCHHSYSGYLTLALSRVKKPVVTSFLNVLGGEGYLTFIEKAIHKTIVSKSSAIIVKNDSEIRSKIPEKSYYLPNGVNMDFFNPMEASVAFEKLNLKSGKYILFVSGGNKFRPQKRYDIFQKVLRILNKEYHADVKELCLVNTPRDLVPYYFNASVLHLLPSDFEGSPNSIKEALACNISVVATDVGNIKDMIHGLEGCHTSLNNDPNVLAELASKVLLRTVDIDGRGQLMRKNLDLISVAKKLAAIYNSVIESS